jgi:hypothetical protein
VSAAIGVQLLPEGAQRRARSKIFWSYAAIVAFALLTAALVVVHAGSILNIAFPAMAACLAGALFIYRRSTYVAFTWWIWLASPEVRRLVDFQTHFHNISPVMVAPLLVTFFALLSVIRRPRKLLRRSMLPFLLYALTTLLAFVVGVLTNGFLPAAFDWANWLLPLSFGVFLIMDSGAVRENRDALMGAVIIGLAIIGAYGIYQFFHLPPWDAYWLNESRLTSAGSAFAEQVRIFGPLNGPGAYGFVLAGSLVFMLVAKGPLKIASAAAGFPAFALCGVRAAWGVWAVGALFVFWRMGGKSRIRIAVAALVVAAISAPVFTVGPVATLVTNRFASFGSASSIQQDQSAKDRAAMYQTFIGTALSQPIGIGLGALGTAAKLTTGNTANFDSGLLQIPYTFGWVGCLVFVTAVFQISLTILGNYLKSRDPIANAAAALFFGMLGGLLFGQVFEGVLGIVIWTAVGLALSQPLVSGGKARSR